MGNTKSTVLSEGMSRRQFAQGAMAAGVAGVLGAMGVRSQAYAEEGAVVSEPSILEQTGAPSTNGTMFKAPEKVPESDIVETVNCDIVVVGAGISGMSAVLYASSQGANVHVLEKGSHEGVHRLCVAGMNAKYAENFTDAKISVKDFTWDVYRCMGGFQTKMPLLSRYAKDSGKWIDWLAQHIAGYGWMLLPFPVFSGIHNNRTQGEDHLWPMYDITYMFQNPDGDSLATGKSPNWMTLFRQMADDYGAHFHFDEPGYYLEREDNGRVTGIISRNRLDGTYRRYVASKGILLAAGDFYNDKQMVHNFAPHLERCVSSICEPNDTGDMHKAGIWVGAAMDDYSAGDLFGFQNALNKNWISPLPGEEGYMPGLDIVRGCMWAPAVAGVPGTIWVDDGGRRFANENQNTFQQAGAQTVLTTPTGRAWSVWDGAWETKFPEGWQTKLDGLLSFMSVNTQHEIDLEIEEGLIQKYDTLEELAQGCGFDVDYFMETINHYNDMCDAGEDTDCFKAPEWLCRIDQPPYYAAQWGAMITSTRCGLKTDEHSRVIDTEGRIIPGLYAAGNNGGNFYGMNYPGTFGGTGIGHGQFFSWVAARDMLGEDVIANQEA